MSKKKLPEISVSLPTKEHLTHFTSALSVANAYRMARGESIMSLERYALNCMVEASNGLLQFHQQEQKRHAEEQAKAKLEAEPAKVEAEVTNAEEGSVSE